MTENLFQLKYGDGTVSLEVPEDRLQGVLLPREVPPEPDETAAIRAALANPIGAPRLEKLVGPGKRVVVVVSDITRPAPTARMLPPLLDELNRAGVPDSAITIVFALGIHRAHTREERERLVGPAVTSRVRLVDADPTDLVDLGTTSRGTPVRAFRLAVEADFRICTGNVEYHYFAGYSGGAKALVPGVCGRETVEHNHSMMLLPGAAAGEIERNPVRLDIEEAAERIGADFVLNTVLDAKRHIVRAVAGEQRAALRAAAAVVDEIYGAPLDRPADIVVASAGGYPKDINLYQAQKAIDNARWAVREGGILLLAAECREGLGEDTFAAWMESAGSPDDLIARLRAGFVLGGHKAAALAMAMKHADVYLYSAFAPDYARRLFFHPVPSLQAGLDSCLQRLGPGARVLVIPNAGSVLPKLRTGAPAGA
ncbi:MAG TPA: nickel-dependent lactate racemase [Solirubrobacterales bacterium]